jgi:molybdate transport system substrate-binding protein
MKISIVVLALLCTLAIPSPGEEITVAAAADLRSALEEIAEHFQHETSTRVKLIAGASGSFYQQIQNGAPCDLFFSADTAYPKKLEAEGLALPGTYYEYARGRIVLLVASASRLNLEAGLEVLLDPRVKKIAIADPAHAPYGQAAVAALRSQHLYDRVSRKLVMGENVSQAASFVLSGAADIGIIARSLAILPWSRGQARYRELPDDEYPPIQQACVVLKSSQAQKLARRFESYVAGPEAAKILEKYGFEAPAARREKALQ